MDARERRQIQWRENTGVYARQQRRRHEHRDRRDSDVAGVIENINKEFQLLGSPNTEAYTLNSTFSTCRRPASSIYHPLTWVATSTAGMRPIETDPISSPPAPKVVGSKQILPLPPYRQIVKRSPLSPFSTAFVFAWFLFHTIIY